jgi:hypothetical protein
LIYIQKFPDFWLTQELVHDAPSTSLKEKYQFGDIKYNGVDAKPRRD